MAVWIVMFRDVQVLDVTRPLEVFALANPLSPGRAPRYEISDPYRAISCRVSTRLMRARLNR